ncbi:hypothetical protein EDD29_5766 [Actinocorallia herbida]|uniref:Uncharacterized protein n=1 Tax=Actinocorallia herbida TaxID=58109 RepID=A0A3N1D4U3_9ACTN|nr:hypothetical protein [Actinocorallia herbida]ROO88108.1 hypothetical protein EDD29_5766 [Actinocorallia herbida]
MSDRPNLDRPGALAQISFDGGHHILRGTVIGTTRNDSGRTIRLVSIPGFDGAARIPAQKLRRADPFPAIPVPSLSRTATSPSQAKALLTALSAAVITSIQGRARPDPAFIADRIRLAEGLGAWAGAGTERVLKSSTQATTKLLKTGTPAAPAASRENFTAGPARPPAQAAPHRAPAHRSAGRPGRAR